VQDSSYARSSSLGGSQLRGTASGNFPKQVHTVVRFLVGHAVPGQPKSS